MIRTKGFRSVFWMAAIVFLAGCSYAGDALQGAFLSQYVADLNAFLPPTLTPFLPMANTAPVYPPLSAGRAASPAFTATSAFFQQADIFGGTPSFTYTVTATETVIPLPSATRTAAFYIQPTVTRPANPVVYPSATPKRDEFIWPTATPTETLTVIIEVTQTPTILVTDYRPTSTSTETQEGDSPAIPSITPTPTPTVASTATTAPSQTPTPTSTPNPANPFPGCTYTLNADFEQQIFGMINQARADAGWWSLSWYGPLASGAQYHSIDMGCNKYFAHTGGVYENILAGINNPVDAFAWWWNSKPHHDNILGQYYYKVGVGFAYVVGSPYRYYWTIQFSR